MSVSLPNLPTGHSRAASSDAALSDAASSDAASSDAPALDALRPPAPLADADPVDVNPANVDPANVDPANVDPANADLANGRRRRRVLGAAAAAAFGVGGWTALQWAAPAGPRWLPPLDYRLIDGRRLGAAELHGKAVLVNFWATSCAVCVAEMPELAAVYQAFRARGLELVAVAMPYDRPDHVLHFASTRRLPFPVALDPMGEAVAAWGGVAGTPLTWLAGPDGRIRRRWLGRPDFAALRRELDAMLPGPAV